MQNSVDTNNIYIGKQELLKDFLLQIKKLNFTLVNVCTEVYICSIINVCICLIEKANVTLNNN